jgi:hypothetical protein
VGCKKIEAGPKPNPANKGRPKIPSRFTGDYMNAKSNVKAYNKGHPDSKNWGRPLPGFEFGKWQLISERGDSCDYQRIGINHKTAERVIQEHTIKC